MSGTDQDATGAAAIEARWRDLGGENAALGASTSPPLSAVVGLYRPFSNGLIAWCEQLGAHALFGAVAERWIEKAMHLGAMPVDDQRTTPAGTVAALQIVEHDGTLGEEMAICAGKDSTPFEVSGRLWQHWRDSGAETSPVGFPVDSVGTTIDGEGFRQQFQHGWICWHPAVGAGSLTGAVADRWSELDFEQYGYPVGSQETLPDGRGESAVLATLQADGSSLAGPMIVATPEFGAWEVDGEIQAEWKRRGREAGELGYPIGAPSERVDAPGIEQLFENDRLEFPPDPPEVPRPVVASGPIRSGGLAALGGRVTIQINPDGTAQWSGHAHNSGADNYDYSVRAVLGPTEPGVPAIVFAHSGSVYGTFHPGSRDDDWLETLPSLDANGEELLKLLRGARIETATEYESGFVGAFETVLGWAVKALAAYTAGTGTLVLVFLGTELGSLAATGSLLPGAQIIDNMYWMAGPFGSLVSIGAQGLIAAGSEETEVTQEQYDWANERVFNGSLPPRELLRLTDWSGQDDRAFTFPRFDDKITLNMGRSGYPDPRTYWPGRRYPGETFIHELVHACQAHHDKMGLSYLGRGIAACVEGKSSYKYPQEGGFDYTEMGLEAQAQIVSDWYASGFPGKVEAPGEWKPKKDSIFYRYITDNVWMGVY